MHRYKKILVPLDGSDLAEIALEPALDMAEAMGAEVILFRVAPPLPNYQHFARIPVVYDEIVASAQDQAERYLKAVRARWPEREICTVLHPPSEVVAEALVDYAAANQVDLIVMSSHGRTGLSRWVHGSVTEKVLQAAPCATLVVRRPQNGSVE